jgi:hypothetical protein
MSWSGDGELPHFLFDRDITRPERAPHVDALIEAGAKNDCHFCLARKYDRPRLREGLFFLNGLEVGAIGRVVALKSRWLSSREFEVRFPWAALKSPIESLQEAHYS